MTRALLFGMRGKVQLGGSLLLWALVALGCEDGGSSANLMTSPEPVEMPDAGRNPAFSSIQIEPASVALTDRGDPVEQTFSAQATNAEGEVVDVSSFARFELVSDGPGVLAGRTFRTDGVGGENQVRVRLNDLEATALIQIRIERTVVPDDGSIEDPEAETNAFEQAPVNDSKQAPSIVYPNSGVMVPPNLLGFEIHFLPGDNERFRVRFQGELATVDAITRCEPLGDGCRYLLPLQAWQSVGQTGSGKSPFVVTIESLNEQGDEKTISEPIDISIAAQNVEGGLYYWSTSRKAIMRVDFGAQTEPEQFWPPEGSNTDTCYGCHALSPDGEKMTLSQGGINQGQITLLEVQTRAPLVQATNELREQFQSWNPTSAQFAAIYGDGNPTSTAIRIRDGESASVLETIELGIEPSHVDWSPAGDKIAFTKVTRHGSSQRPGRGGIAYVEAEDDDGWSELKDLVDPVDGLNHYTPAISPDGRFVAYARSECTNGSDYNASCDGDADPSSQLFAIRFEQGPPLALARANEPGATDDDMDLSQTFPKWAPFVDAKNADGSGRLMWFTFSSRRRYGLRPPEGSNQLLWMAAVDPDLIEAGKDGSFAPFVLPFQDFSTSNHIAQWAQRVVPTIDPVCLDQGKLCAEGNCCSGLECIGNREEATCQPSF